MSDNDGSIAGLDGGSIPPLAGTDAPGDRSLKRGRGRPPRDRGSAGADPERIDPAALGSVGGGATGSVAGADSRNARRGRKPKEAPLSIDTLLGAITVTQLVLVQVTQIPECVCNEIQNRALAEAAQKVFRHLPNVLTEKQQDIAGLAICVGAISFTQFRAYQTRKIAEATAQPSAADPFGPAA